MKSAGSDAGRLFVYSHIKQQDFATISYRFLKAMKKGNH